MGLYGISNTSQLAHVFGTGASSFSAPIASPTVSKGTFLYGTNNAKPSKEDFVTLNLKQDATELRKAVNLLSRSSNESSGSSVFVQRVAKSSNENTIAVQTENVSASAKVEDLQITVSQLATKQVTNSGTKQASELGFSQGAHTFSITDVQGKSVDMTVEVTLSDTNASVYKKMADSINRSGTNASARIEQKDGSVSLLLASKSTGAKNAFSIQDKTGALVSASNVTTATQAQDASFVVDGQTKSASTNHVKVGRIDATLKEVTAEPVTIHIESSNKDAKAAVNGFVSTYNKLVSSNEKVGAQLFGAASTYKMSMANAGFSFASDGKISISEKSLENALEKGSMKSLFSGGNTYGLSSKLTQIASGVERSPQAYTASADTYSSYNANRVSTQQNQVSFMLGSFYNGVI